MRRVSGSKRLVALEPDFENGYALAVACLNMQDKSCAANVFSEMLAAFGDTAVIHRQYGLAYGNSDFQQEAIVELQKAIAKTYVCRAHTTRWQRCIFRVQKDQK
jgi:hypothetical protein